jgi:hypothetical protein
MLIKQARFRSLMRPNWLCLLRKSSQFVSILTHLTDVMLGVRSCMDSISQSRINAVIFHRKHLVGEGLVGKVLMLYCGLPTLVLEKLFYTELLDKLVQNITASA